MNFRFWKNSKKLEDVLKPEKTADRVEPSMPEPSRLQPTHEDHEKYLMERKKELQKILDQFREQSAQRKLDTGLASAVVGVAIVFDSAFFGGLGTIAAVGGSAFWARNGLNVRRVNKELKEVNRELVELRKTQERKNPAPVPEDLKAHAPSLKDEFGPSVLPDKKDDKPKAPVVDKSTYFTPPYF